MARGEVVREPARDIPVFGRCDVLVVGGGPAGTAAAACAARMGANTVLVERYGCLGGMSTGGYVVYIERMTDWHGRQVIAGFADELLDRIPKHAIVGAPDELWDSQDPALVGYWADRSCAHFGVITHSPTVDPEALKIVSNDIVLERGVELLFHSWGVAPVMDGNRVLGVIFESKSGRQAVLADVVIDATGDGDIFTLAGARSEGDIESADIHHTMNLAFLWGGLDMQRFFDFRRERPDEFRQAAQAVGLSPDAGPHAMPRNDVAVFMGPRLSGYSATDIRDLTAVEIESRRRMMSMLELYRRHMPGFEDAWVMGTASQMGTRHSRRLVGVKKVTRDDWVAGTIHDDEIGITPPPNPRQPNLSIPLGCLIPAGDVDNLLAAGRNLSCDAATHTFLRLIPQCWAMGQAAGVAAALAVSAGVRVRDVDAAEVRRQLFRQGVVLHRQPPTGETPQV